MHVNEALNARAELKNKEVTSWTSLREPELCLWVSALKAARRIGSNQECHLMVHGCTQAPCPAAPKCSAFTASIPMSLGFGPSDYSNWQK